MPCWTDYIGIDADCNPGNAPASGLFINDQPGITLGIADRLANGTRDNNGVGLLERLRDSTINEVKAKAGAIVSNMMRINKVTQVDNAGEWKFEDDVTTDYLPASNEFGGIRICIPQREHRAFSRIYVSTVEVLTNTTLQNIQLYVNVRGRDVTTKTISLQAGVVINVDIFEEYDADEILIYWWLIDKSVNDSRLAWNNCKGCGNKWKGWKHYGPHAKVTGFNNTTASINGATTPPNTYGISANFQVRCSLDEMLCAMRPQLKFIIWKETALKFYNDLLLGDSFSDVENLRKEGYRQMRDELLLELNGNPENSNVKGLWHDFAEGSRRALSQYSGQCVTCRSPRATTMLL